MNVFITSDLKLNDVSTATKLGLTAGEYNQMIIKKWNEIVGKEDNVLILGDCGSRNITIIKSILSKLNGKKYLIDMESNNKYSRKTWKWAGFDYIWRIAPYYKIDIEGEEFTLWISNSKEELGDKEFCCVGEKVSKEIFNDKKLNVSLENWDYTPLSLNIIVDIIKNYKD